MTHPEKMNCKAIQSIQWMVTHLIRLQPYHMLRLKHLPVAQPLPTFKNKRQKKYSATITLINNL